MSQLSSYPSSTSEVFGPRLKHNASLSNYSALQSSSWVMPSTDHIHVAELSALNPITLFLPKVSTFNTPNSLFFVYCSGASGGQITLSPFQQEPDISTVAINGGSPGASVSYTQGATNMILLVFRMGFNFYICPVTHQIGGGSGSTVVQAGSSISVSQVGSTYTVTNTAPDQVVALASGSGISVTGSYPNFTVANGAPDQVVSLTNGGGMTISGSYPNFTLTNASPDQTVSLNTGTGMSITGTYPSFTITNAAPDQTVTISAGAGISVGGSYPNFSITNSAPTGTDRSIFAAVLENPATSTSVRYCSVSGMNDDVAASATQRQVVIPVAGTISNLRIYAPTGPAVNKTFTLYLNGVATSLAATILPAATSASDTVNTVAVVAGDVVQWGVVDASGSGPSSLDYAISCVFTF